MSADLATWIVEHGRLLAPDALLAEVAERLVAAGVPVARASCVLFTLHPLVHGRSFRWSAGRAVTTTRHPHGLQAEPGFAQSPFRLVHEGAGELRCRLDRGETTLAGLAELRAEGLTDYVALGLCFTDGRRHALSFATARGGGFTEADVALLRSLVPPFQLALEVHAAKALSEVLVDTYLGRDAGRRVLSGQVRRGDGEDISAIVCAFDLRDFTALSMRLARDELLALLNAYFETVVNTFTRHGAEVLKYVGDAVLIVLRIEEPVRAGEACARAVAAVRETLLLAGAQNEARRARGEETFRFGVGMHVGEVAFGNIGAPDRLDFTVIGPAVNLATRLETLSARLGRPVLFSDAFRAAFDGELADEGLHPLKGFAEPVRVWSLP